MHERAELAVSLAGLQSLAPRDTASSPALIDWAARTGFNGVRLDAARPGLRPRDLDRSARRGLGAHMRRLELQLHGIDLWIPPEHFTDPAQVDRAIGAVSAAIELAGELRSLTDPASSPTVSCMVHADAPPQIVGALADIAARCDVPIADHAWPTRETRPASIGVGLDPASVLLAGDDPGVQLARLARDIVCMRLSDADHTGRVMLASASGRLDVLSYAVTASTLPTPLTPVADLRNLPDQQAGAAAAIRHWPGLPSP